MDFFYGAMTVLAAQFLALCLITIFGGKKK